MSAAVAKRLKYIGIGLLVVLAAAVYYRVNPARSVWMPQCPFRLLTGWQCPACGSQRALHSLLHGQLWDAVRYNLFLAVSVPYLVAVGYTSFARSARAQRWRRWVQHPAVIWLYLVLILAWWVVRNLFHL